MFIAGLGRGYVWCVPFQSELEDKYQSSTQADINSLRMASFDMPILTLEEGTAEYVKAFEAGNN